MTQWGGVAYIQIARQRPQTELFDAFLIEGRDRPLKQSPAEISMVIGVRHEIFQAHVDGAYILAYVGIDNIIEDDPPVNRIGRGGRPARTPDTMTDLILIIMAGLLGLGTGIFTVLSLIEKPVWRLMWAPRSSRVKDEDARTVHAILKRVIHLLPPTMMTTMGSVSALMIAFMVLAKFSIASIALATLFFVQLGLIVSRLFKDIRGVDAVPSDGELALVRDGLGALTLLHHRGLLMTASTLITLWLVAVWLP